MNKNSSSIQLGQAQPLEYQTQLDEKAVKTMQQFAGLFDGNVNIYPSIPSHFRMRAEFKIWHEGDTAHYAMYKQGEYKQPVILKWDFSIGSQTIVDTMPKLLNAINNSETLKKRLFQAEFLTSKSGECLITLIYHKPLDEQWENAARALSSTLGSLIIGRSRKQKLTLNQDFINEEFTVDNKTYTYQQVEASFTQPNADICEKMLNWVCEHTRNLSGDLLELYCGNGNFTLPLSHNFNNVLATEISKTSVKSALKNIEDNKISNISIIRMSSEEFTQALNKARAFRRLKEINLDEYNFSTIFVDPPRAGLDEGTRSLATRFDNIIYISCNPDTLHRDLNEICLTHKIEQFSLFDQFPYTDHRECGVILSRK